MNKAAIRTKLLKTLGRNDVTNDLADSFIADSLSRIQRGLRVPAMEVFMTATLDAGADLPIPGDFLKLKFIYAGTRELSYLPFGRFMHEAPYIGAPAFYTRIGDNISFKPVPQSGTDVTLCYYGAIPPLVNDTDSNFLSETAADLITYGALVFAADWFVDDRRPVFEATFERVFAEVAEAGLDMEMGQVEMAIGPAYEMDY